MAVIPTPWNKKTELLEIGIKGYVPPAERAQAREPDVPDRYLGVDGRAEQAAAAEARVRRCWSTRCSPTTRCRSSPMRARPAWCSSRPRPRDKLDDPQRARQSRSRAARPPAPRASSSPTRWRRRSQDGDGTVNRVILATDGDFNVGIDEPDAAQELHQAQARRGHLPVRCSASAAAISTMR